MPLITENLKRAGAHIKAEGDINYCRESVTVTGGDYQAGTVLGKVTANGKYTLLAPAAADGSQVAAAILWAPVDASGGDKTGIVNDTGVVAQDSALTWPAGITAPQKVTAIGQLRTAGIKVR